MPDLVKRTEVYVMRPKEYEISGCPTCGNKDPDWSEYQLHLWCPACQKDFVPESAGIFGGPVCVNLCRLLGIDLRVINMATLKIEDPCGQWPSAEETEPSSPPIGSGGGT